MEGQDLFRARDPDTNRYDPSLHLEAMARLLGPPPEKLLRRGEATDEYFTPQGKRTDVAHQPTVVASHIRRWKER